MRSICQEHQNVPAAIPVAPTSAIAAHIARSTAPNRPTDCVAALLCAAMTPGGGLRASASCNSTRYACAACRMACSRLLRWSTTSFRIAETKSCSGMSATGRRCARHVTTAKLGAVCNWRYYDESIHPTFSRAGQARPVITPKCGLRRADVLFRFEFFWQISDRALGDTAIDGICLRAGDIRDGRQPAAERVSKSPSAAASGRWSIRCKGCSMTSRTPK